MKGGSNILKSLIALCVFLNIGFAFYNGYRFLDRKFLVDQDPLEEAPEKVKQIAERITKYAGDIQKIKKQNLRQVDQEHIYFGDRARLAQIDPQKGLTIPGKSDSRKIRGVYNEQFWNIKFGRDAVVPLAQIANYCSLIESGSPQFQIKEINAGKRSDIWGKNEWKPSNIVVRRITRASAK